VRLGVLRPIADVMLHYLPPELNQPKHPADHCNIEEGASVEWPVDYLIKANLTEHIQWVFERINPTVGRYTVSPAVDDFVYIPIHRFAGHPDLLRNERAQELSTVDVHNQPSAPCEDLAGTNLPWEGCWRRYAY
jgi:hypothetical protein